MFILRMILQLPAMVFMFMGIQHQWNLPWFPEMVVGVAFLLLYDAGERLRDEK